MYTDFYGLREQPFSLTPDPRFLYFTPSHKEVLANLRYGITNGKGLIVVTGEVGTGKTTIVRWMLEHFDRTVLVAYIFNPRLTVNEFYQHMAQLLNIQNWSSKADLMLELGRTLEGRHARGLRTVLIIDEAQGLAPFVLEEIRLLMNFESNTAKYLQIILTGQPELREVLNSQELRQLKQRIALRSEIQPLPNVAETENYILERLRVAGATQPNIFSPEAIDFIFRCSEGIPRQVNNLCDNAMLLAYGAELPIIGRKVIEEVAETFDMLPRKERSVLEAEYDVPPIFKGEARERLREEKVETPQPPKFTENGAGGPRPQETKNGGAPQHNEVAKNGGAPKPRQEVGNKIVPPVRPAEPIKQAATPRPEVARNGAAPQRPQEASNGVVQQRLDEVRSRAAQQPPEAAKVRAVRSVPDEPGNGAILQLPEEHGNGAGRPRPGEATNGASRRRPEDNGFGSGHQRTSDSGNGEVVRMRQKIGKRY